MKDLTLYRLTQRRILEHVQAGGDAAVLDDAVRWLIDHYDATTGGSLTCHDRAAFLGYAVGVRDGLDAALGLTSGVAVPPGWVEEPLPLAS
jgi:hypothetical protein